ncbi:hypothetical protein FZEAL_7269 [Fusarium zealandicum]|uniref:Uncharacterized protein n=1 Tax=Fusarium zealandicum TaxID=1053134 RepID=A0A8H4UGV5_9HYPO|nr:hypothetical protein FZEAL_7269 [Fusarium zealandicum]
MENLALNQQVSRVVSAFQETTLFTAITPNPTAHAEASTVAEPTVTVTSDSTVEDSSLDEPRLKIIGTVEIGIALGVLILVIIIISGIFLCRRHKKAKKRRESPMSKSESPTEKAQEVMENYAPTAAHLPRAIWPRMADKNQKVYEYWQNEPSRRAQGGTQIPQAGMQSNNSYTYR